MGGIFSGLEGSLEKYIEGFFKDKFGGRVQPVEIAKRLAREMRDRRRVSVSHIYVPNDYTVYLHPSDWENISTFASLLSQELQDYVKQKASEKRYTLAGPPRVKFSRDESLPAGGMRLESGFTEAPPEKEVTEGEIERTQPFFPLRESALSETSPVSFGKLVVEAGPDQGKVFDLKSVSVIIGRWEGCDIVLSDASVSRRHARLDFSRGQHSLTDLDSTNGTRVNGVRVKKQVLRSGDVITLGTTVCTFKVE